MPAGWLGFITAGIMIFSGLFSVRMYAYSSLRGVLTVIKFSQVVFYNSFVACIVIYMIYFEFNFDSLFKIIFYLVILYLSGIVLVSLSQKKSYYQYTHELSHAKKILTYNIPLLYSCGFLFFSLFLSAVTI